MGRPKFTDAHPEAAKLLGKVPDEEIVAMTGVHISTVKTARSRKGIPKFGAKKRGPKPGPPTTALRWAVPSDVIEAFKARHGDGARARLVELMREG